VGLLSAVARRDGRFGIPLPIRASRGRSSIAVVRHGQRSDRGSEPRGRSGIAEVYCKAVGFGENLKIEVAGGDRHALLGLGFVVRAARRNELSALGDSKSALGAE